MVDFNTESKCDNVERKYFKKEKVGIPDYISEESSIP